MDSQRSPFARGWTSAGSHSAFYGESYATYTFVPYGDLPKLDAGSFDASFAWLPERPQSDDKLAFEDLTARPSQKLARLSEELGRYEMSLPESFVTFVSKPEIHNRVPTCTACYLDLADRTIQPPGGADGRMLRFMNDQQSVLLWYLYIRSGDQPAVLVATPEFDDDAKGETIEDVVRLTEVVFCAPTFEEFILRFWLENTIWFSLHRGRALTAQQTAYLNAARRAKAQLVGRG